VGRVAERAVTRPALTLAAGVVLFGVLTAGWPATAPPG